ITGKVDLAVSGITATLKRAKKLSFSRPYFITQLCLLASKDSKVQSYRELDDESVTIVVKQGTTGQITAEKMFPKAKLKVFDQEAACALEIANGNGDVFIYDKATLRKHYENHKAKTRFLPEPFSVEPYAMAFRRGDPDFGRFLDQFLMTIELDGRLAELRRKWGLDK
ncbi:MAG: transporter substrate-binding domain-containing protein, partial [Planctomycetota bacterium]